MVIILRNHRTLRISVHHGGTVLRVTQVIQLGSRLRARLQRPPGWITLRNTETGRRNQRWRLGLTVSHRKTTAKP